MNLERLTKEQIKKLVERHKAKDVSYFDPSFGRRAKIRWRLYNAEVKNERN